MILGIISDTHDDIEAIDQAFDVFEQKGVETIIHCGDWIAPDTLRYFGQKAKDKQMVVKAVVGNNETEEDKEIIRSLIEAEEYPIEMSYDLNELTFEVDGEEYALLHGHEGIMLESLIQGGDFAAIFRGHTHKPDDEEIGGVRVINPGAVCKLTLGEPTKKRGIAIFDTENKRIEFIPLGE